MNLFNQSIYRNFISIRNACFVESHGMTNCHTIIYLAIKLIEFWKKNIGDKMAIILWLFLGKYESIHRRALYSINLVTQFEKLPNNIKIELKKPTHK